MDISYLVANARNQNNEFIVRLDKMYDDLIQPLDTKYKNQSLVNKRRVICPFHEDIKPSLGMINSRNNGMPLFNCFGCGAKGNSVHFYIYYNRIYKNRELSLEEATIELANQYNIDLGENMYGTLTESVEEQKQRIIDRDTIYSIRDYQQDCKNLKSVLKNSKEEFAIYLEELQSYWREQKGGFK